MPTVESPEVTRARSKDMACKIAAVHGEKPKRITVKMVGSSAIKRLVSKLEKARERNLSVPVPLD